MPHRPSGCQKSLGVLTVLSCLQVGWFDLCKQKSVTESHFWANASLQSGGLGLLTAVNRGEAEVLHVPWAPGTVC